MKIIECLFGLLLVTPAIFSQPNPRHLEEVTFDKVNNKLLVFGGIEMKKDGWTEPSMVYEWNGKIWQSKESNGPLGRRGHLWVYDESQKQTLLMGGVTTGSIIKDSLLFDVWTWDGSQWKLMNAACPVKEKSTWRRKLRNAIRKKLRNIAVVLIERKLHGLTIRFLPHR